MSCQPYKAKKNLQEYTKRKHTIRGHRHPSHKIIAVKDSDEFKVKRKNKRNINIKTCVEKHLQIMLWLES